MLGLYVLYWGRQHHGLLDALQPSSTTACVWRPPETSAKDCEYEHCGGQGFAIEPYHLRYGQISRAPIRDSGLIGPKGL